MGPFTKKSAPVLGVDIGSAAIKVVELKKQGNRYQVEGYAVEPLPQNAVVEKNISDVDAVSRAIKSAVKRSQSRLKEAATAVPASSAISRTLVLDGDLRDDEMEAQVNLQAEQYIPYPLEEVNLDFEVRGPAPAGDEGEVEVLLVASRNENVEIRVDALSDAGLTAKVMDVDSYALENAMEVIQPTLGGSSDQTIAVVDIGATVTSLTVFEKGSIVYTRDQVFGGRQLTEEIARRFDMDHVEAERYQKQGGLPDSYETEVLQPFREAMAQQVNRSLQFFFGASQHNSVDQLVVAGGCAGVDGAGDVIAEATGTETTIANPFSQMSVSSRIKPQQLANDAPALMTACGLALRSFD